MVYGTPRRQVMGEQFPCTATADGVTDAVDNLPPCVFGRTAARHRGRNERFQISPLSIGKVTVVRLARSHLARVPHASFSNALLDYFTRLNTKYASVQSELCNLSLTWQTGASENDSRGLALGSLLTYCSVSTSVTAVHPIHGYLPS
jgi:hypothetical protein